MILQPHQIQELLNVIDSFHVVFIAQQVGADVLSPNEVDILKLNGIDVEKLKGKDGKVQDAFKFGVLAEALSNKQAKGLNYDKFKSFVGSGKFLPLTQGEESVVRALKYQAYNDIKGLGNKINKEFTQILIEVDQEQRKKYEKDIETEAEEAIINRETQSMLTSKIGHKTGDWSRDLDRIADFVLHSAFDYGKAYKILEETGEDAEVYKSVYKGACKHCIDKYLTNGLGSEPRIFKLKDLMANGTNIGVKTSEWKAVIGPLHPFCRCELEQKPKNSAWNQETQDFTDVVRNMYGVERKSKIKIKIIRS